MRWPPFRSATSGRSRRPRNSSAFIIPARTGTGLPKRKKGRLNDKRPKSREETPKEGSDSAKRYRTATICDRAAQKASTFDSIPAQS